MKAFSKALLVTLLSSAAASHSSEIQAGATPRPGVLEKPAPRFEVRVEKSVFVPMRDGIKLSTDIYFPVGDFDKLPVVLIRTPYGKTKLNYVPSAHFFAGQGFAVAVQDFRGKFESEGEFTFTYNHRDDGYDTIEWLAQQRWSNGKVGTYACSYGGEVQLYQAPSLPKGLAAMIPQAGGSMVGSAGGFFKHATDLGGGAWMLAMGFEWFRNQGSKVYYHPTGNWPREDYVKFSPYFNTEAVLPQEDYSELLRSLPIVDLLKKAGAPPTDYEEYLSHTMDLTDPYWDQFDYLTDEDRIDAPTLFIESWNDWTADAALYARNLFEKTAVSQESRDNQYIIVSPTTHCRSEDASAHEMIGDQDAGDARFGHYDIYVKWFDRWLRGDQNAITDMPKVQYYLLGKNEWRAADTWPVPGTEFTKFYLHSGGEANSHYGDGNLSTAAPVSEPPDNYRYDPGNPVPSTGVSDFLGSKPVVDQRPVSARHDVLVYTSAALENGFEMTGDIEVVLYVSSSAKDTDFVAKLVDVYPDGSALNLREGIARARFRNGRDKPPAFMEKDGVYEVRIKLGAYSSYFKKGHKVRLQVTSSSFPRYDRNLNTGGNNYDETEWVVADNTIHHSAEHRSYVLMPIVK